MIRSDAAWVVLIVHGLHRSTVGAEHRRTSGYKEVTETKLYKFVRANWLIWLIEFG